MNNPVLNSESFERAAYQLGRSLENFGTGDFDMSVVRFERAVDKLARVLGMQAENDYRKACGHQVAYVEDDFHNA